MQIDNEITVNAANENIGASPLVRHLAIVLVAKLTLLVLLWWLFFRLPDGGASALIDVPSHIAGPVPETVSTTD